MSIAIVATRRSRQSGAVLIITLIFLVVITLVGVTAMQTTTLGTKMMSNYKNNSITFEAAEAGLREGESRLAIPPDLADLGFYRPRKDDDANPINPKIWPLSKPGNCTDPCGCAAPWWVQWKSSSCWKNNAIQSTDNLYLATSYYIIEYVGHEDEYLNPQDSKSPPPKHYFRITAIDLTQDDQTKSILQSVFAWRYKD